MWLLLTTRTGISCRNATRYTSSFTGQASASIRMRMEVMRSIMIAAGKNLERLTLTRSTEPVNQPMLAIDAPRPPARQVAFQELGLSRAGKRMPHALADEQVDARGDGRVFSLPLHIVGPGGGRED